MQSLNESSSRRVGDFSQSREESSTAFFLFGRAHIHLRFAQRDGWVSPRVALDLQDCRFATASLGRGTGVWMPLSSDVFGLCGGSASGSWSFSRRVSGGESVAALFSFKLGRS